MENEITKQQIIRTIQLETLENLRFWTGSAKNMIFSIFLYMEVSLVLSVTRASFHGMMTWTSV